MFARLGRFNFRFRFAVIAVMVGAMLGLGGYGIDIAQGKHLSQGGLFDNNSQSAKASRLLDSTYGRDHSSDVVLLYTAPDGKTVDDPAFVRPIVDNLSRLAAENPGEISGVDRSYWTAGRVQGLKQLSDKSKKHAFATVKIKGDDDTTVTDNYQKVKDAFDIPGIQVEVAGLQPVSGTINATMNEDVHRMEILAIPAVAVLLFFIFGGLVAAALPLIIGGLTIVGGWGIVRGLTLFTSVNSFVVPVVSMVGLGLAIDYGLFIVSRFREELAEGYDTKAAVRRSVMTSGRTVAMSATMIVASCAGLLLFPQSFLKSLAYGAIATVTMAAVLAVTVLPAMLSVLGPRVDALGFKWMRKTKTTDEIDAGIWGRLTRFVMRHPLKIAVPIVIGLSLLIIPVKNIAFGGVSETLLPPDNPTRLAQEHFDQMFPTFRSSKLSLVVVTQSPAVLNAIVSDANQAPGLTEKFLNTTNPKNGVYKYEAQPKDPQDVTSTLSYLRTIEPQGDAEVMVTGTPALQQDSLNALISRIPLMIAIGLLVTTLLMFLTFGSLVLPVKAALMSALGLGSTLGILTWIFIDGHGASLLNFTPGPIMAPVLVLIIALIFGLSTDYEVFLLSRMVEARTLGASTTEAVRVGMAHTSRIITAAALILIVVTGAFGFSHLVMMQYIAYGMISALVIDATLLRMFLVPATMKLLGDDCWWAPAWMKRMQEKIGLAEPILADERLPENLPVVASSEPASDRPEDALTLVIPTIETGRQRHVEPEPERSRKRRGSRLFGRRDPSGPPTAPHRPPAAEPHRPATPPAEPRRAQGPSPHQAPPPEPPHSTAVEPEQPSAPSPAPPRRIDRDGPPSDRRGIENWLSDLRSPGDDREGGRHQRNTDSVSVNDLLRRRDSR